MKNIEEATSLTVELAKLLIPEMQSLGVQWQKAFVRMEFGDRTQTCKGSYVLSDDVQIFDVLQHKRMFESLQRVWPQLRDASANSGKLFCVALLIVDSAFNYEVQYEYEDSSRWSITKLGGGSGLPVGYVA